MSGSTAQKTIARLNGLGVEKARDALRASALSLDAVNLAIDYFEAHGADWPPGVLYNVIREAKPGRSIKWPVVATPEPPKKPRDGRPPAIGFDYDAARAAWRADKARTALLESNHGPTLDRLANGDLDALARRAGYGPDVAGLYRTASMRKVFLEQLAREAEGNG